MDPTSTCRWNRRHAMGALLALACGVGRATEPTRLIVAYPPGGPADLVARQLGSALQRAGRATLVENIAGAGGGIGVARLLAGGGNAWLVGTPSETIVAPLLNPALGYGPEQLRLVGVASTVAVALVGTATDPARPIATLLARGRDGTARLVCGNYGIGSHAHLAGIEFEQRTGVPLLHVPLAGVAPLLRELVAGRIDLAFLPVNRNLLELVDQGRLRLHALAAATRDARWPELPTVDEVAGTRGIRHRIWVGLFIPATTGAEAAAAAREALALALGNDEFQQQRRAEFAVPGQAMDAAEAAQLYAEEAQRYRRLLEALQR